jgi:hypothetical protein
LRLQQHLQSITQCSVEVLAAKRYRARIRVRSGYQQNQESVNYLAIGARRKKAILDGKFKEQLVHGDQEKQNPDEAPSMLACTYIRDSRIHQINRQQSISATYQDYNGYFEENILTTR